MGYKLLVRVYDCDNTAINLEFDISNGPDITFN